MADIPAESSAALQKRRAIQALMKDASLSPAERNQRMQQIMMGKVPAAAAPSIGGGPLGGGTAGAAEENALVALSVPTKTTQAPEERGLERRGSSAKQLIEHFQEYEKHGPPVPPKEEAFSTINSVGTAGRGRGYEESDKLRPTPEEALRSSLDTVKAAEAAAARETEKTKRAFIPAKLFGTNRQALEERVRRNSPPGGQPPVPVGMEEFEARIRAKSGSQGGAARAKGGAAGAGAMPPEAATLDEFEERVRRKSSAGAGAVAERRASSGFDDRLARKMSSVSQESSSSDAVGAGAVRRGSGFSFEERLRRKMSMEDDEGKPPARSTIGASSGGSAHDERLLWRKMSASAHSGHPGEEKLAESMDSLHSFEARVRHKSTAGKKSRSKSRDEKKGKKHKGKSAHAAAAAAGLTKSASKRNAIAAVMADESLNPSERNQRLAAAMAGDWDESEREDSGHLELSESEREGLMALEAKIAHKLKARADMNREHRDLREECERSHEGSHGQGSDEDDEYGDDGDRLARTTSLFVSDSGRDIVPRSGDDDRGDGGYGSLPLPEEHFASEPQNSPLEPQLVQDEADENYGLAVATAIADDDEPEYVYNAVEYDPFAKPPLHRNRRFRVYTYFALILIGIMVVLVVVYVTSASKGDEVVNKYVDYQAEPSRSPTPSPITDREASGVIEQLEGGVLLDGESFVGMERGDPRLLALDWILHLDMMQLVSDDPNLYQRFALAVMAYSLDSRAWYSCGDPGANYTESVCSIVWDENTTETHGMWLSSTSECSWYGVICSGDGVVRGIDLNNNDLIGILPRELSALSSLQLLALPHNCLYGPIPSELGRLRHLLSLELHGNGLSGEMPNTMYDLEKLQLLNLANQWGVQRECNATNGRIIDINYKKGGLARPFVENAGLTGALGAKVGVWRSMKGLYLNKNSFDGSLSDEIGNLRYLRFLAVDDNFIEGSIPTTITKLRNLRYLQLGENFLVSSLPSDLGRLTDIERLMVNGNSMYGDIPDGLYKLTKLKILRLDETLEGQAPWMVDPNEGFTGSISTQVGGLEDLQWLMLSNNPLTGTIPTELGLCEKLEVLRVHRTSIGGTMPKEVCMLRDKELNHEGGTGVLYADCRPTNRTGDPFLKCDCCSDCCDHATGVCIADD